MITWADYEGKSKKFWKGKLVRTLLSIENGNYVIPAGTVFEITDKYKGFSLRKVHICPQCGIGKKIDVTRVDPTELELLLHLNAEGE